MPTLSTTGSIIWIPQLYLNYKFKSHHAIFFVSVFFKFFYLVLQISSLPYFLRTGLFWLVLKYYSAAILGQLINALICIAMIYQQLFYAGQNRDLSWPFPKQVPR